MDVLEEKDKFARGLYCAKACLNRWELSRRSSPSCSLLGWDLQSGNYLAQYSWTIVIIVFVALSIGIMGVSLLQWEGQQSVAPLLRLFLAIPTVCLGMPLSLILSEKKLKQTVLKRAKSVCFNCQTKVAPMLNQ